MSKVITIDVAEHRKIESNQVTPAGFVLEGRSGLTKSLESFKELTCAVPKGELMEIPYLNSILLES